MSRRQSVQFRYAVSVWSTAIVSGWPGDRECLPPTLCRRSAIVFVACVAAFVGCMQSPALDPHAPLDSYARHTWSTDNGLPQNSVHAILQTSEGFLWLGTEAGLVRFDGYEFRVFRHESFPALLGDDIHCLLEDRSGALWAGTDEGLTRIKSGVAQAFPLSFGRQPAVVRSVVESGDGRLWVLTSDGLAEAFVEIEDPARIRFQKPQPASGSLEGGGLSLAIGSGRDVWIGTSHGLLHGAGERLEPGPTALAGVSIEALSTGSGARSLLIATATQVMRLGAGVLKSVSGGEALPIGGVRSLLDGPEGIWAAGRSDLSLLRGSGTLKLTTGRNLPGTQITALTLDHEGTVWVGTNAGIGRLRNDRLEVEPRGTGGTEAILTIFEDRQGGVWFGTETEGAKVWRDRLFDTLPGYQATPDSPATSVMQTHDGDIWIGTDGGGLVRISKGSVRHDTVRDGLPSNTVFALAASGAGLTDAWAGTPDGLGHLENGRWRTLTSADGLADDLARSLLRTHDGSLWIGSRHGVTRWKAGQATILSRDQGLGSDLVGPLLEDADGDLWIGTSGGLSRLHAGVLKNYTVADGLPRDTISALGRRAKGGFWIGTRGGGLALWNGTKFRSVSKSTALPLAIYSALEDESGALWLTSDHAIYRISIDALDAFLANGENEIPLASYGVADGLPSLDASAAGYPLAWRLEDGRLCFASRRGVIAITPSHLAAEESPVPVVVEDIALDDHSVDPSELASIAPGQSHLSFSYAGIHLASPQRVQYSYMLQGVDRSWVDAGARRTAFFTNIPHGRHVFRVRARIGSGSWGPVTETPLELRPHAYETLWFRTLCVLLIALSAFGLYRLRLHTLRQRFEAVGAERNRLAREIHDTLAQSFVAVSVRLELISRLLGPSQSIDAVRGELDNTRAMVRDSLAEARRSIWDLRADSAGVQPLPARLARLVQDCKQQLEDAQLEATGTYRPLPQSTENEVFRIAQEAVTNVLRHARASTLHVRLGYDLESLFLEVRDDGRGFDVDHAPGHEQGHFGMRGMRERARILGTDIMLESHSGQGTAVRMRLLLTGYRKEKAW